MAAEAPATVLVAVECCEGQGQHTPDQRVVHDGYMVRDSQQSAAPGLGIATGFDQVKEVGETIDLGSVEAEQKYAAERRHCQHRLIRRAPPQKTRLLDIHEQLVW